MIGRFAGSSTSTFRRLTLAFLVMLAGLLVLLHYARFLLEPYQSALAGRLMLDAVIVLAVIFFCGAAFAALFRIQGRLERNFRELEALHHAAIDIYGELSLDVVLQKVVDQARGLLEARYGAVSVIDGEGAILQFVVSGIDDARRARIGAPPVGRGLLGVVMNEGQRIRLRDLRHDPRSAGMPDDHPEMRSLLAVPIVCRGPFRGNLYLAEKETAAEFTDEDEETLVRFAVKAAIAIDNAHLHERLRDLAVAEERVRIAREMHDGMAQVLAYVNTKAQAVKEFLRRDKTTEASAQLEQLAAAAREVYVDVREGILGLRTPLEPGRPFGSALATFVERWEVQCGISADVEVRSEIALQPAVELQLLRILQEALSNVRKHSRAEHAVVAIEQLNGALVATVEDDGAGFDPKVKQPGEFPRFGLAIMRERAESIGGALELESRPGGGTRVRVEIPLTG